MEWIELAKAIGELGIMIVICALFLIQNKSTVDTQQNITKQMFDEILDESKKNHDSLVNLMEHGGHVLTEEEDKNALKIDKIIGSYLQQIVIGTKATRAFVVRYHNGGRDMTAQPFLKCSMTNEVVDIGVTPVIREFQNQFRSMIAIVCNQIEENGESYITDLEDIQSLDAGTYGFLKGRGIKNMYCVALRNQNDYIIGFVAITYMVGNTNEQDLSKIKEELKDKANNISALLCLK